MRSVAIPCLALLALTGACERAPTDPVTKQNLAPPTTAESSQQALFAAAFATIPADLTGQITVGVQERERTQTFARVSFEDWNRWHVFAFRLTEKGWSIGEELEAGTFSTPRKSVDPRVAGYGYSGLIANIYAGSGTLFDQWYVSSLNTAGQYASSEDYPGIAGDYAQFFEGTQVDNNIAYEVQHDLWSTWMTSQPYACRRDTSSLSVSWNIITGCGYPDWLWANYTLNVYTATASISDQECNDSNYFRLNATGGGVPSGTTVSAYAWETSPNGTSWSSAGSGSTIGCFPYGGTPFYARVTITYSNGQSAQSGTLFANF